METTTATNANIVTVSTWSRKDALQREDGTPKNITNGTRVRTCRTLGYRTEHASWSPERVVAGRTCAGHWGRQPIPDHATGVVVGTVIGSGASAKAAVNTKAALKIQWSWVPQG